MPSPLQMHLQRLKKKNMVVEEIFKHDDKVFARTLNGDRNDSVYKAKKIEKNYYLQGKRIYQEKKFDKDITYTITLSKGDSEFTCSECGYHAIEKEFYDGCPYCGASFYLEQGVRQRSLKTAFQEIFSMRKYKLFLGSICTFLTSISFISLLQSEEYPWFIALFMMIAVFPTMLMCLHLLFTLFLLPYLFIKVVTYHNLRSDIIMIDRVQMDNQKIIRDLNYQLLSNYYDEKVFPQYQDLIDFEILEYENYKVIKKREIPTIRITYTIRKYFEHNGRMKKTQERETVTLIRNQNYSPKFTMNSVKKCPNCSANVGLFDKTCPYCNSILPSTVMWVLDKSESRKS